MNLARRLATATKSFVMTFAAGRGWWWSGVSRTKLDYAREVGDGRGNAALMACVGWICRTFPEAPVRISTVNAKGELDPQRDHPLKELIDTPNEFYSGELMWWATLADRTLTGNAYWLKIRAGTGKPVQLWWVPSSLIEPRWPEDGSAFISHYEYSPNGKPERIEIEDVVHFRYGLDPQNPRKGLSPVASLVREIFTDDEAANYTASMLRNTGVPPVIISPGKDAKPTTDELREVKDIYMDRTTGDNRGMPIVMRGETTVQVLGFNPQQMDLRNIRFVPEERITAVLGIHAAVVGLGSGLVNTKVGATMEQMREQAYESNIIPTQRVVASELRSQLLPDFGDVKRLRLDFDLSQVRVLQEDQNALYGRLNETAWMTIDEKRSAVGLAPLEGDAGDALLIPTTLTPTDPALLLVEPEPSPALPSPRSSPQPAKVLALPDAKVYAWGGGSTQLGMGTANGALPIRVLRKTGEPLELNPDELTVVAEVTEEDLEAARVLWREEAPEPFADLLDAEAG